MPCVGDNITGHTGNASSVSESEQRGPWHVISEADSLVLPYCKCAGDNQDF